MVTTVPDSTSGTFWNLVRDLGQIFHGNFFEFRPGPGELLPFVDILVVCAALYAAGSAWTSGSLLDADGMGTARMLHRGRQGLPHAGEQE